MHDSPDRVALVRAVADFLTGEVRERVADRGTSFRLLIAAHMLQVVAAELDREDELDLRQWQRQANLLGVQVNDSLPPTRQDRKVALRALDSELVRRIRQRELTPLQHRAVRHHLLGVLRDELSLTNPKFDTRPHVGRERPRQDDAAGEVVDATREER